MRVYKAAETFGTNAALSLCQHINNILVYLFLEFYFTLNINIYKYDAVSCQKFFKFNQGSKLNKIRVSQLIKVFFDQTLVKKKLKNKHQQYQVNLPFIVRVYFSLQVSNLPLSKLGHKYKLSLCCLTMQQSKKKITEPL